MVNVPKSTRAEAPEGWKWLEQAPWSEPDYAAQFVCGLVEDLPEWAASGADWSRWAAVDCEKVLTVHHFDGDALHGSEEPTIDLDIVEVLRAEFDRIQAHEGSGVTERAPAPEGWDWEGPHHAGMCELRLVVIGGHGRRFAIFGNGGIVGRERGAEFSVLLREVAEALYVELDRLKASGAVS